MVNLAFSDVVGKTVMVMITFRDDTGKITGYQQFHGAIINADENVGIVVSTQNNGEIKLPPQLSALQPAMPGQYRESSSGSVIVDPDYISLWEINLHAQEHDGYTAWKYLGPMKFPSKSKEVQ
jgi:hypothetical protein